MIIVNRYLKDHSEDLTEQQIACLIDFFDAIDIDYDDYKTIDINEDDRIKEMANCWYSAFNVARCDDYPQLVHEKVSNNNDVLNKVRQLKK